MGMNFQMGEKIRGGGEDWGAIKNMRKNVMIISHDNHEMNEINKI